MIVMVVVVTSVVVMAIMAMWDTEAGTLDYWNKYENHRTIRNDFRTRGCCSWFTFLAGIARNLQCGTVHLVVNLFFAWCPHANLSPSTPVLLVAASVFTKGQNKLMLLFYVGCSESNVPYSFSWSVTKVECEVLDETNLKFPSFM
jgi:hypothetical protein